jgi:NAD(P)-dependent dehydrogenase (short-subunit alcohol dehydrogenase family)
MEIDGQLAIVTGAAAGAGREIALRLAGERATVVVADIDRSGGERTVHEIDARGGSARFLETDVRTPDDVRRLADAADGVRILVNNAGGGGHIEPHFPDAQPDDWGATLDLNLRGPMLATQMCLEPMWRNGGGVVVNIASTGGVGLGPHQSPEYAAAKAGLIRFTATLAGLRERMNVRVNCVVPDWIETERARDELARMTAAERATTPTPLPPHAVPDGVLAFIRDDALAGRVMLLMPGEAPRLLDAI